MEKASASPTMNLSGLHTRLARSLCTLHAVGYPPPCNTRFRLVASLGRVGVVTHRVAMKVSALVMLHWLPPSPSFLALLHQLSKMWADSREFWGLAGVQALGEIMKYDADLWRKASADKGLRKSASSCFQQ